MPTPSNAKPIVVAGLICLDIIPGLESMSGALADELVPGHLVSIGPAVASTGGAVANTGLALQQMGFDVRLAGKVGDDAFGGVIRSILARYRPGLDRSMAISPGSHTSYTIVFSPPGIDRTFWHCPGANDDFVSADVPDDQFAGAGHFHLGYPPLMRGLYEGAGGQTRLLLSRARRAGLTTSLDLAHPQAAAVSVDWAAILKNVLPETDVFMPSLEETLFLTDRPRHDALVAAGGVLEQIPAGEIDAIAGKMLDLGAAIVAIKLADQGLFLRVSDDVDRLGHCGAHGPADVLAWVGRRIHAPCFAVDVAGTTGSGDCTIAGFIAAMAMGMSPEDAVVSAVAAGACNVERPDATSGIVPWDRLQARIAAGWAKRPSRLRFS